MVVLLLMMTGRLIPSGVVRLGEQKQWHVDQLKASRQGARSRRKPASTRRSGKTGLRPRTA